MLRNTVGIIRSPYQCGLEAVIISKPISRGVTGYQVEWGTLCLMRTLMRGRSNQPDQAPRCCLRPRDLAI
jgi:hypothetical protein